LDFLLQICFFEHKYELKQKKLNFFPMEIQDLKTRLSILEVADRLDIRVDKQGKALCPFHDDKTPSLQFSKEKNICTCFSSKCDAGTMDIIGLTEKKLQLNTHEAIMQLKEWANHQSSNGKPKSSETHIEEKETLSRIALLTKVFRYFENGMKTSKTGKEYLQSRNLVQSTPTQKGIEVGYNAGSFYQRENKYLVESALKYGLIKPAVSSGHTAFGKGCLVFPLKNKDGQIVGMYFREADDIKSNHHYYLQNRQGLYPNYPKPETTKLILTESIIDAATLMLVPEIANNYQLLACYGTNGLTEEHVSSIASAKELQEVIFFFDGDKAGKEGIKKNAETLRTIKKDVKISFVETPEGEDINSLSVGHEKEIFTHLLESRKEVPFLFSDENLSADRHESSGEKKKTDDQKNTIPISTSLHIPINTTNPNKITYATSTAQYQILGGLRKDLDSMRVSLTIRNNNNNLRHRSKPDLFEDKQVEKIAREAAEKLGLRADLIEIDLNDLTDKLEIYRESELYPETKEGITLEIKIRDYDRCKMFLSKPNLISRFNDLIGKAGVTGEENNRIFLFCIASSYKMPDTLHALIQGTTGSGKTHLLTKVSSFIPHEDRKHFTRVTEGSFYNYGTKDLKNKLICLEDLDGMREEAYLAFRELQSRGMITSSTTGQDDKGNIRAYEKVVYGPIASLSCTTRGEIYEDNMSRCFIIAVDETREQTERIITYQNQKATGKIDGEQEQQITAFVQDCIRILKPHEVINPYADKVQLPREAHKIRRLNDLYQSFVKQVTLINQYRRASDSRNRLISQKEDLQTAADIMFESILLKVDELDGSLRLFYEQLKEYVEATGKDHHETYSFSQREIRQALNISKSQLQRYLRNLASLEYIQLSGGHINRGFKYKISYWDNINKLRSKVKRHLQGQLDQLELL
jgi:DNA primase catalytic core